MSKNFTVSYKKDADIRSKSYEDFTAAAADYEKIVNLGYPAKLVSVQKSAEIMLEAYEWNFELEQRSIEIGWLEKANELMSEARIARPQREALLSMGSNDLCRAVALHDVETMVELDGVGEKTALKAIAALKSISVICGSNTSGRSKAFKRVILNNDTSCQNLYQIDTIRKGVSPLEEKAEELGGQDAIVYVVSMITETKRKDDFARHLRAEKLAALWHDFVYDGITIGKNVYVWLGHGTNSSKECHSIWCKKEIHTEMNEWLQRGADPEAKNTVAKDTAYKCGLQAVPGQKLDIPFMMSDVAIMPTVIDVLYLDVTIVHPNGKQEDLNHFPVHIKRSDGYGVIDIPDKMVPILLNRMIDRGDDPEEAKESLRAFMQNKRTNSYRANAALKGCFAKNFKIHKFLKDRGVTKTKDGRNIDDICIFVDETVMKTAYAYKTFEDHCKAIGQLGLRICVNGHKFDNRKSVSYQAVQAMTEASNKQILGFAGRTVKACNDLHTVNGISRKLGRELGHILRILPTIGNVNSVKRMIAKIQDDTVDEAFGGRLLNCATYAFVLPDQIYVAEGWFDLERKGCLKAGQMWHPLMPRKVLATFRSPVMNPNELRNIENVELPEEVRKYFSNTNVFMLNCCDDTSEAQRMDFDGDHWFAIDDNDVVAAFEETHKVWNRLLVWDVPHPDKVVVTRDEQLKYAEQLTRRGELGITVYGLNALLNRLLRRVDPETDEETIEVVPLSKNAINFKTFAGNVLVDANKHGSEEIEEPEESKQAKHMLQPWPKIYRDAVKDGADRATLDKLANFSDLNKEHMVGTANKLFAVYSKFIRRDHDVDDIPNEQFDHHKLMYQHVDGKRGLFGLIRRGEQAMRNVNGSWIAPDQGLFDALARRLDTDWINWNKEEGKKDNQNGRHEFEMAWRAMALVEIQRFAEGFGKTLEDAHDVVTWYMFTQAQSIYESLDGKYDFILSRLWKTYWIVFGGMAEENAMRYEKDEDAE